MKIVCGDSLEAFDRAKSILHHLHIDDRYPGNGPSKVVWSDELAAFVVRAEDLAPVLDMYVHIDDLASDWRLQ